ncbi:hypothetical protein [Mannheimia haemolytica]|uniref:hypothetical protein n=1 Tax=Mannheimia haemolytica TaxID=75985 RepID=UPI000588CAD8|nr:hypothetical protein [Mannheimia haemolytica]AJE07731.1 hypothetical protein B824_9360 [Mannheimia haemolytica USDA-ARS-USMARC-184]UQX63663.1 hypothetical protein M3709_04135 [Mannheimia haemolytica]HDL5109489.1 hypothetical protein [Mannheimia haemolytica]HDL5278914.1 hypothetical protein [Mannheimia haemolytica]HDL5339801.1 hypothetical protein [Mannheimia haemolytica]
MAYFVNVIDEQGNYELIDDEFIGLYPDLDFNTLPKLTDKQYQTYLAKANGKERFVNGEFVYEQIKVDMQAVISAEKSAKLAEINQKAQAFINDLAKYNETPQFERDTWLEQAKEAKAWVADPTVQTPTLALIAQMRGIPLDTLRQKAYEKAMAYQTVAAIVAGQRQGYEDRLEQAETLEQIQAIKPMYQLPQGANNEQTD